MYKTYIPDFFIFGKSTELCRFVTYLWNDPRKYLIDTNIDNGINAILTSQTTFTSMPQVRIMLNVTSAIERRLVYLTVSSAVAENLNINTECTVSDMY